MRGPLGVASFSDIEIGDNKVIGCRTLVQNNQVTVQVRPSHYLHGQLIIRVDSKSSGQSSLSETLRPPIHYNLLTRLSLPTRETKK